MTVRTKKIFWIGSEADSRACRHGKRVRRPRMQSGKEVAGCPVVTCRVTSIMLDGIEETFEEIALGIKWKWKPVSQ
jgi:hypothetical protein